MAKSTTSAVDRKLRAALAKLGTEGGPRRRALKSSLAALSAERESFRKHLEARLKASAIRAEQARNSAESARATLQARQSGANASGVRRLPGMELFDQAVHALAEMTVVRSREASELAARGLALEKEFFEKLQRWQDQIVAHLVDAIDDDEASRLALVAAANGALLVGGVLSGNLYVSAWVNSVAIAMYLKELKDVMIPSPRRSAADAEDARLEQVQRMIDATTRLLRTWSKLR